MDPSIFAFSDHTSMIAFGAFFFGAFTHHVVHKVEIDSLALQILQLHAITIFIISFLHWKLELTSGLFSSPFQVAIWEVICFDAGFLVKSALYRLFFHPLSKFPGPLTARLTKFWAMKQAAATVQWNVKVQEMHHLYGDFVRIGPREISINRPSAIQALYGPPSVLRKAPWYAQLSNDPSKCSVNATRDVDDHRRRRRAWDRGLGSKALASYEPSIISKADSLISQLYQRQKEPINFTKWSFYYAFDVMGHIGLGNDFHMTETGVEHEAIAALHGQMFAVGVLGTVPWLLSLLAKLPVSGGFGVFMSFCVNQLDKKIKSTKKEHEPRDILTWILKAQYEGDQSAPTGRLALEDDARLLITAGSDSTAAAVTNALFFLARSPDKLRKLQMLLDKEFPHGSSDWTLDQVKRIPYATHVINETLRLKAPIPLGLPRLTPREGLQVDEVFIPGDTIVSVPTHTIQLDSRYFKDPLDFIPERWEDIANVDDVPFLPFSRGSYSCAGKQLAIMEIITVVTKIVLSFDFKFYDTKDDGHTFDKGYQDTFVLTLPELMLKFEARN